MNGFEKHGLKHSSASQINMWIDAPDAWCAKYLFGASFSFGVAPLIGTLVEKVVEEALCGGSYDEALARAHDEFRRKTVLVSSEKDRERIADIDAMARNALEVLEPYGEPEFITNIKGREQQRIELKCNGAGWTLPIVGYLDFVYPKHGLVIDLKTTLRIPSVMSDAHKRQAAIYHAAKGNSAVKFLYVSPKKTNLLEVDNYAPVLAEIKAVLNRQERFLRMDKEQIKEVVPNSLSSFYWSDDAHIRTELYGV